MTLRDQAYQSQPLSTFIIDAHTHIGPNHKGGWHQKPSMTSLAALMETYDSLGVNCCVTAPHVIVDGLSVQANEEAAAAAAEYPGRIYGYLTVVPNEGMDILKQNIKRFCYNPAFVGMKFLAGYQGTLDDPVYQYAAGFANEARCPILCHTWSESPTLDSMRAMAERYSKLHFICAHLGGGSKEMTLRASKIVKEVPNFHLEICGSLWNHLGIDDVVEMVGADRVIFGTDAINLDPRFDFGRVAFAPLSDEDMRLIFGGNFLALLEHSSMGKIKTT